MILHYFPNYIPKTILTFITLSLNLSSPTTFPINQLATITPTPFLLYKPNPKKFRTISNHFGPCPFRLFSWKQQITIQRLFKVPDISPHFPHINPRFHVENRIPNCTSDFPIIRARVHSVFLPGFSAFFLSGVQCFLSNVARHW